MKTRLATQFQAQELIPEWWHLKMATIEDIKFLGEVNIRQMVRTWRGRAQECSRAIVAREELLSFIQGKTAKGFADEAKKFENPEFRPDQIGLRSDSWGNDPEPLDGASINRERGATTFNVCGWCKYAGGGSGRHNYMITTSCNFLTEAGMDDWKQPIPQNAWRQFGDALILSWSSTGDELQTAKESFRLIEATYPGIREVVLKTGYPATTERRFYTPCFLPYAGQAQLDRIRTGLAAERDRLVAQKRETDKKIRFLLGLARTAEHKPALYDERPYDWFNINDPVVCYVGKWEERRIPDIWATAQVIMGYRHLDGCVSVRYDKKVHNGDYLEGHGGGYGMSRPEVMHAWEYEYLRANPDFARVWLESANHRHLKDFDPEKMLEALTTEQTVV